MKIRLVLISLASAAVFGAAPAVAQQAGTLARLSNLEGSVLVSQGDAMVAAANDQRVPVGARVVTMAGGRVVVRYDSGCDVALKENQRFVVRAGECGVLLGEVTSVGPTTAGGTGAAAGISANTVIGGVALAGFGYAAYEFFRNKSVSPN